MMNEYYKVDPSTVKVNEPRETAKDILLSADKILVETHELLRQICEALIGIDEPMNLPDVNGANMLGAMMIQREKIECIRSLVVRLKERLY